MFLVRRTFEICSLSNFSNMQYSIVYYNHHAVYYILMTYLFYNWKFVPFDVLHSLLPPPPSASGNHPSVLNYPWACFFFVLFCFRFCKWDHTGFIFLLSYFTWRNALKGHHCCCKWQDFILFFYGLIIFHYTHTYIYHISFLYPFICWWVLRLFPYLGGGGGLVAKSCPTLETPWTV